MGARVRLVMMLLLAGCATGSGAGGGAPSAVKYEGGDGLSCETRVLVRGAANDQDGVAAEYEWLRRKYPGYTAKGQTLMECDKHPTDQLAITTAEGRELTIHFDISDFFGKGLGL